jgi:hypothetical protein
MTAPRCRRLLVCLALVSAITTLGCRVAAESRRPLDGAQALTPEVAARYAPYAMMSYNSYHRANLRKHPPPFPLEAIGWRQVDDENRPVSAPTASYRNGLAYDIFARAGTDDIVFAFRGTENWLDFVSANFAIGLMKSQYTRAKEDFRRYVAKHPGKTIAVTGHSLGGSLANTVSVSVSTGGTQGADAYVFNASPRVFDGIGDHHLPAHRVMIYESGEVLTTLRRLDGHIYDVVDQDDRYVSTFAPPNGRKFNPVALHSMYLLAAGMLCLGAQIDTALAPLWATITLRDQGRPWAVTCPAPPAKPSE